MDPRYELYDQFIKRFPIESLSTMTLEQYTDLNRADSFCYWIEFKTRRLGSIAGGSSFKFGIYRYANRPLSKKIQYDEKYAWYRWFKVDTAAAAFDIVRNAIVEVANAAAQGNYKVVEENKVFGDAVKWKIAFIYSGMKIMPMYVRSIIEPIAEKLGYLNPRAASFYDLNKYVYDKKGANDELFSYSDRMGGWGEGKKEEVESIHESIMEPNYYDDITTALKDKKSIILQGAPGTGKTYAIPEIVTRLCAEDIDFSDRKKVMDSFSRLVSEKRVVFTTFHQSMDYEDFVEGLKPFVDENKNVYYDVVDGIFKTICKDASKPIIRNNSIDLTPDATIWKVSLGGTYENEVRTECLKNSHIRIGWDSYGENYEEQAAYAEGGRIVLDAFYNKMTEGDIVFSCYSNRLIDAIGVVEGEPEWHDEYKSLKRLRKVRWLVKGIKEDISIITGKSMTLSTVYKMNDISVEHVLEILRKHSAAGSTTSERNTKPYVIVIDEINRGNVSKIFGELITLLEADKRTDGSMPLTVRLPYSKKDLGIPSNLYLIGTMNTADRSLSQFDYAMRRRFRFITMAYGLVDMKPAPGKVFQEELFAKVSKLFISNYDEYLEDVNVRLVPAECFSLEFKPIDLWIGPSYFITDENEPDSLYNNIFYEIIPTLEHYIEDGVFVNEEPVNAVIEELKNIALNP